MYTEETYYKELDLATTTAKVRYFVGDVEFMREHFTGNPNQVIFTKITESKSGSVSFAVSLDSKLDHHCYIIDRSQIVMERSCPGKRTPPKVNAYDDPKGIQFAVVFDVEISDSAGLMHVLDNRKLKVAGADWVVLLLVASSSFEGPFTRPLDLKRDPTSESLIALKSIKNLSYSELYSHHFYDYRNLFDLVSLQLYKSSDVSMVDESSQTKNLIP